MAQCDDIGNGYSTRHQQLVSQIGVLDQARRRTSSEKNSSSFITQCPRISTSFLISKRGVYNRCRCLGWMAQHSRHPLQRVKQRDQQTQRPAPPSSSSSSSSSTAATATGQHLMSQATDVPRSASRPVLAGRVAAASPPRCPPSLAAPAVPAALGAAAVSPTGGAAAPLQERRSSSAATTCPAAATTCPATHSCRLRQAARSPPTHLHAQTRWRVGSVLTASHVALSPAPVPSGSITWAGRRARAVVSRWVA